LHVPGILIIRTVGEYNLQVCTWSY